MKHSGSLAGPCICHRLAHLCPLHPSASRDSATLRDSQLAQELLEALVAVDAEAGRSWRTQLALARAFPAIATVSGLGRWVLGLPLLHAERPGRTWQGPGGSCLWAAGRQLAGPDGCPLLLPRPRCLAATPSGRPSCPWRCAT